MGNLCGVPSITIIINSRDFEDEICNPKSIRRKPAAPPTVDEELSGTQLNFMKVDQL